MRSMRSWPTRMASCGYGRGRESVRRNCWPGELGQLLAELPAATGVPAGAMVTVPFLAEGRVTGMLAAAAAERKSFSSADVDGLQELADRVALSLERARLAEL